MVVGDDRTSRCAPGPHHPNERPGIKAPKKERALLRAAYEAARDLGADQTPRRLLGRADSAQDSVLTNLADDDWTIWDGLTLILGVVNLAAVVPWNRYSVLYLYRTHGTAPNTPIFPQSRDYIFLVSRRAFASSGGPSILSILDQVQTILPTLRPIQRTGRRSVFPPSTRNRTPRTPSLPDARHSFPVPLMTPD